MVFDASNTPELPGTVRWHDDPGQLYGEIDGKDVAVPVILAHTTRAAGECE